MRSIYMWIARKILPLLAGDEFEDLRKSISSLLIAEIIQIDKSDGLIFVLDDSATDEQVEEFTTAVRKFISSDRFAIVSSSEPISIVRIK